MYTPRKLTKAKLIQVEWPNGATTAEPKSGGKTVTVQFNPASLRVGYSNQVQTNDQSNNSSTQFVGKGSAKLSLELIFDISMPLGQDSESGAPPSGSVTDVRELTREVAFFITPLPAEGEDEGKYIPPGTRFSWGSFYFDGIVESMDETLDLWSEDGRPLRATVALNMSQQGVVVGYNPDATDPPQAAAGAPAGTRPLQAAQDGDSIQGMATKAGRPADWKLIAQANGIENPRVLAPGTLVDMAVRRK